MCIVSIAGNKEGRQVNYSRSIMWVLCESDKTIKHPNMFYSTNSICIIIIIHVVKFYQSRYYTYYIFRSNFKTIKYLYWNKTRNSSQL